jgi:hypothetical protein
MVDVVTFDGDRALLKVVVGMRRQSFNITGTGLEFEKIDHHTAADEDASEAARLWCVGPHSVESYLVRRIGSRGREIRNETWRPNVVFLVDCT